MMELYPRIISGFIIFLIMIKRPQTNPKRENKKPSIEATRNGNTENAVNPFSQSNIKLFNESFFYKFLIGINKLTLKIYHLEIGI